MAATKRIGEGLTFEKVWAAIQATNEQIKANGEQMKADGERMKADSERMKEQMKANSEQMKEQMNEQLRITREQLKEQMKETDRRLGKLGNRFGEMVEYTIVPKLAAKFNELGFVFEKTHRDTEIRDLEHNIFTEIDAFLENGDRAMVVEIKTKPSVEDINDHIERMEKLRRYADFHNDKRKYLGALAGVVFGDSEKRYALRKGLYVIEPSGDSFNIVVPDGEYYPHEW
jgi:hypothetical protein